MSAVLPICEKLRKPKAFFEHEGEMRLSTTRAPYEAADTIEELYDGCNALLGLLQLLLGRDDLPDEVREAMQTSHRVEEAEAATAKARGEQPGRTDPLGDENE